jgi:opacity protein-like surface antigen
MKTLKICLIAFGLQAACAMHAGYMDLASHENFMRSGLFAQIGASYNSVNLNQRINGTADSEVYDADGDLAATGTAGGPDNPFNITQSTFAPVLQLGYAHKVDRNEDWSFGFKLSYKFLGLNFSDNNINSFQVGDFVEEDGVTDDFTGHFVISSYQTIINNELNLMGFVNYAVTDRYNVYLGVSPVLFDTHANIYGATGYADINGTHSDITGNPANFFNQQWMWGTAGEIGLNYNLNDRWFLNLNYNYGISGTYVFNDAATFVGTTGDNTTKGTANIATTQRVISQSIGFAINFIF